MWSTEEDHMHDIDDAIGSYLLTMEAEGKTAATLVSYTAPCGCSGPWAARSASRSS